MKDNKFKTNGTELETKYKLLSTIDKLRKYYLGITGEDGFRRDREEKMSSEFNGDAERVALVNDTPLCDDRFSARVYIPDSSRPLPIVIFFHGGGFITGKAKTPIYDDFCRFIANRIPAVVVSCDYRKAPEHKYPSAHQDAYDTFAWVYQHAKEINGDTARSTILFSLFPSFSFNLIS